MNPLVYARRRLGAVLTEIDRLAQSEFAYPDSRDALEQVRAILQKHERNLARLSPKSAPIVVNNECSLSLDHLFVYLPILGLILRSTNVRNAFEVYSPLLRLARNTLGASTKLLISSEWDYSPFVYTQIADLPGFVLIGLPASESGNPLLLPLAGHELGHSLWRVINLGSTYQSRVQDAVVREIGKNRWSEYTTLYPQYKPEDLSTDIFARRTWEPAYTWAMLQLEEVFCDAVGVRSFAESYLDAFAYLIAPRTSGARSLSYPNMKQRIEYVLIAADAYDVQAPIDYMDGFEDSEEPIEPTSRLLVSVADTVCREFVGDLVLAVGRAATHRAIPVRSTDTVDQIAEGFENLMPVVRRCDLTDILNAGWKCFHNDDLWVDEERIEREERMEVLQELILKSIEVLEIHDRLAGS